MTFGFSGVHTLGTEQALATECTYDKVRNQFYRKLIQLLNDSNTDFIRFASYIQGIKCFMNFRERNSTRQHCGLLRLLQHRPTPSVVSTSTSFRRQLQRFLASPPAAPRFNMTPGSSCVTFGSTVLRNRLRAVPAVLTAVAPQNVSSSSAAVSMLFSMRHLS